MSVIELGNLAPLRQLADDLEAWEAQIRARPLPEADPVVQTLVSVRKRLTDALENAKHVEMELSAAQYAELTGIHLQTLYKRWQRGQLPQARMRGGKLAFPVSALTNAAA